MPMKWMLAVTVGLWLPAQAAPGDTLVTSDNREFEGKVVDQDSAAVVFDVYKGRSILRMTFKAAEVRKITFGPIATPAVRPTGETPVGPTAAARPASQAPVAPASAPAGPTYFVIPIRDVIGMYVTAAQFEQALKDVERFKPTVVILEVDSGGGSTEEAGKIIDLMCKAKGVRFVAYVKKAISAAAILSMACKEIYVDERATFGGALSYAMTAGGPAEIGEKMQSIWRATCRSAAELGEHPSILAEGMVDKEIEIQLAQEGGKPVVREGVGATMLKRKGRLLTMTAKESVACGLAKDIAAGYDELGRKLGLAAWTKPNKAAEVAFDKHETEIRNAVKRAEALAGIIRESDIKANVATRRDDAIRGYNQAIQAIKDLQELGKRFPELHISEKNLEDAIRRFQTNKEIILRG